MPLREGPTGACGEKEHATGVCAHSVAALSLVAALVVLVVVLLIVVLLLLHHRRRGRLVLKSLGVIA